MLPTTPARPRSAANSRLGLERVGMTLVPGVIRAGQWVVVADPSHGEERGRGCCVSACLSAHPWRAAPPPRQPANRAVCGPGGCAGGAELVPCTYDYQALYIGTTSLHRTCSAARVVASTPPLAAAAGSHLPWQVPGYKDARTSVWTHVTVCRCGVHATREESVRSGRRRPQKKTRPAPFRRPSLTTGLASERELLLKPAQQPPPQALV